MAWPSGTKASTTNVDQGADKIALARPDIKQNIDNVNDIIDTFNISSPNDGDLLKYSSSTGKWEQVNSTNIISFAILNAGVADDPVSGNIYRKTLSESFDPGNFLTVSGYTFTLPSGNYMFESFGIDNDNEVATNLYNETDGVSIITIASYREIGTTNTGVYFGHVGFTLSGTKTLSLRQDSLGIDNRRCDFTIRISKF